MRLLIVLLIALLLVLPLPGTALAHGDGEPWLFTDAGNVEQGETFTLSGEDLDANGQAVVEISSFGEVYSLGVVPTDEFGHFTAELTIPVQMKDGYALVEATGDSGTTASMWILVGDQPDLNAGLPAAAPAAGAPGDSAPAPPPWADPSVLVLAVFLAGAAAALLYLFLRPSAPRAAPARATSTPAEDGRSRRRPRKAKAGADPRRT